MDQNSTANNTNNDAESVQGSEPSWAPMGGNAGDGGFHEGGALPGSTPGYGVYNQQPPPPPGNNNMNTYPPQQSPQIPYQQGYNSNANPSTMGSPPPASAPPPPGSYAARSAQAYVNHTVSQPSVSVNSTPTSQQQGVYGTTPPRQQQQPSAGGYAARAAHAHAAVGQASGFTGAPNTTPNTGYGGATPQNTPVAPTDGSFAARSQQAYASATGGRMTSPQPSMNNATNNFDSSGSVQQPQQQPYGSQQQQQPASRPFVAPGATPPHAPTTPSVAQGGYAARSAQAYATSGQQSQQQQQQPPSTVVVNNQYGASPPPAQKTFGGDRSVSGSTIATNQTMPSQQMPNQYGAQQQMPNQYGAAPQPIGNSVQVVEQRLLTDATRKVQEHAYYMKQAMDQNNLPSVLERAAYMAGELGVPPHGHNTSGGGPAPSLSNTGISVKLTPKNYYELFMRALEDMSSFEDYLLTMSKTQQQESPDQQNPMQQQQMMYGQGMPPNPAKKQFSYTMRELYDCVQYCPRVLSRLYLQISAGSALIRSGEVGTKWVLNDLIQCVKCEQNPIRGLFLRNHLLTVLRDKLPDTPEGEAKEGEEKVLDDDMAPGNVKDSYEFVMENFMEMNKLWVRLQYMPGDGNTKEVKKRRERERNDLRILVGTNLVRISQLEGVTSKIYGESILPRILDHIVTVGDPLSQAYLMDCLVQVFPDEYHIETMPILLNVCPRLRDKVNVRTILQGLMDRLSNYLADEELLDESDTNQVKLTLARDSFGMFEECVQKVYNARGPKLTSKEVIRLQTALLQFSLKRDPGNMEQIAQVMGACVTALQQANASYEITDATMAAVPKALDDVAVVELEKLLSIPVDSLALRVLELKNYVELVGFLPWANRRAVAKSMLEAVDKAGAPPKNMDEIKQLFSIIEPLTRSENAMVSTSTAPAHQDPTERATSLMAGLGVSPSPAPTITLQFGVMSNEGSWTTEMESECALVSKLVQLLDHENTDVVYEMLSIAREQIRRGSSTRASRALVSVVIAALKLARRIESGDTTEKAKTKDEKGPTTKEGDSEPEATSTDTEKADEDGAVSDKEEPKAATNKSSDEPPSAVDESQVENADDVAEDGKVGESPKEDEVDESPKEEKKAASVEIENKASNEDSAESVEKMVTARQVFIFVEQTIILISKARAEIGLKLLLEAALTADKMTSGKDGSSFAPVAHELLCQCYTMYEERISEPNAQRRSVTSLIGGLLRSTSLSESNYESLITKTAQFSAKLHQKADQCRMVAECSHLFFPVGVPVKYSNAQRALECLQRSLKLADAATSSNASNMVLFVDLLEHYLFFLENKNPTVTAAYVTGLGALIKEYLRNATDARAVLSAKTHFISLAKEIKRKKAAQATSELFAGIEIDTAGL